MRSVVIHVEVTLRWWVRPYIFALACFAKVTGAVPDEEKLAELVARHGFKTKVVK